MNLVLMPIPNGYTYTTDTNSTLSLPMFLNDSCLPVAHLEEAGFPLSTKQLILLAQLLQDKKEKPKMFTALFLLLWYAKPFSL